MIPPFYDTPAVKRDADELVQLLGERFDRILARTQRGLRSKTPPTGRKLHTLAQAVATIQAVDDDHVPRQGAPFDLARLELRAALSLIRPWVDTAQWQNIARAMSDEYPHVLGAIGVLRWLSEFNFEAKGFRAELVPETDQRKADIRLVSPEGASEMVEVKLPLKLMRPAALTLSTAREIVEEAFSQAGSSSHGQLRASDTPTLVIAGLWLTDRDRETMLNSIVAERPRWRRLRPHVRSVGVLRIRVEEIPVAQTDFDDHVETTWSSSVGVGVWFVIPPGPQGQTLLERSQMSLDTWWRQAGDVPE